MQLVANVYRGSRVIRTRTTKYMMRDERERERGPATSLRNIRSIPDPDFRLPRETLQILAGTTPAGSAAFQHLLRLSRLYAGADVLLIHHA